MELLGKMMLRLIVALALCVTVSVQGQRNVKSRAGTKTAGVPCLEGKEENSPKCSGIGTYQCGACSCPPNYVGEQCECADADGDGRLIQDCINYGSNMNRYTCSARGSCVCGVCQCDTRESPEEMVYGKYCECDNFSCDRSDGKLCGGNGRCMCGVCMCKSGYTGHACDCPSSTETCMATNGEICSGNGDCVCGHCQCEVGPDGIYSGQLCEECPTCAGKCDVFKSCVQCKVFQTGELSSEQCESDCNFFRLRQLNEDVTVTSPAQRLCVYVDDDGAKFKFVYGSGKRPYVIAQVRKDKPEPSWMQLLGGVSAASTLPPPSPTAGLGEQHSLESCVEAQQQTSVRLERMERMQEQILESVNKLTQALENREDMTCDTIRTALTKTCRELSAERLQAPSPKI